MNQMARTIQQASKENLMSRALDNYSRSCVGVTYRKGDYWISMGPAPLLPCAIWLEQSKDRFTRGLQELPI